MRGGYPCTGGDMYGRWGYILWDRLWPSMHGGYPCTGGDMYGRWGYILLDRLCPSMHDGYPCTGRDMYGRWGYILWDRLCPSMHAFCTVHSYYDYSQYILPRNVYVQFSLITIIANTSFPVTFMYSSLLHIVTTDNIYSPGTFMYSSLSFDYRQYIRLREVYSSLLL
jgi:hypothetical protein